MPKSNLAKKNLSPLNMTKYSQPLELVLFLVINYNIKYNKSFHYPHLLNNYLFIYLIFSGLTKYTNNQFQVNHEAKVAYPFTRYTMAVP